MARTPNRTLEALGVGATCGALLDVLGRLIECGTLGSGYVVKLVTNQIWLINAAAVGETLVLGKKAGVELPVLSEALKNSVAFADQKLRLLAAERRPRRLEPVLGLLRHRHRRLRRLAHRRDQVEILAAEIKGERRVVVPELIEDASGVDLRVEGDWPDHSEA